MQSFAKTTTKHRQRVIDQLLEQNDGLFDDLSDIVTNPDESVGADQLKEDLEEYSFASFGRGEPNHPLCDLIGDLYFDSGFPAEGVLLVHEDRNKIPLYAIIYLDETATLRGYVPSYGNPFNPQTGKPYGEGGIYAGLPEGENNLDTYDDIAAVSFGYTSYVDMLNNLSDAWPHLYDKGQIITDITQTFNIKPKRWNQ